MGGGGPQGSQQMMGSYGTYMDGGHQGSYDNDNLPKSSGGKNDNRQDRGGGMNSGSGYGPGGGGHYQNMNQNSMMGSYGPGQQHHGGGHHHQQSHHSSGGYQ